MDKIIINDYVADENKITQETINNLKKPKFILIDNNDITNYIYQFCKKLLHFAKDKHESKEMAYAINLNTLDFAGSAFGNSRSIDITPLVKQMENTIYAFIVMHNHPSNNPFSPRDLSTFIDTPNIAILMVLGNKGSIYIIEKMKSISDNDYREIKKIIIQYRNNIISFEDVILSLQNYNISYNRF